MNLRSKGSLLRSGHVILRLLVVVLGLLVATPAAQAQVTPQGKPVAQTVATLTADAPIFVLPDATRKPLRILPVGSKLNVLRVQGDWLQVTFDDLRFGRRTGWIEQKFVKLTTGPPPPPEVEPPPVRPTPSQPAPTKAQPAQRTGLGLRGFGTVTYDKMSASESFKAVTEKDTVTFFGGGAQVTNLWRGLFAEVAVERASRDGERVFVGPNNEVFRLGIPLKIKMTPFDIVGGWRSAPVSGVAAYGAAGFSSLKYEETSEFAAAGEDVDERFRGFVLFGGVEYSAMRWVHLRFEVRYRSFKDAVGAAGVSQVFEEDDLGSVGIALKVAVGR